MKGNAQQVRTKLPTLLIFGVADTSSPMPPRLREWAGANAEGNFSALPPRGVQG